MTICEVPGCGKPVVTMVSDLHNVTKPGDEYITYEFLGTHYFCEEHKRDSRYFIQVDDWGDPLVETA